MRLRIMSDLHFEFHGNALTAFIKNLALDNSGDDVLVLAGDITTNRWWKAYDRLADAWPQVVYVPGNHEYYGTSAISRVPYQKNALSDKRRRVMKARPNFHWLENSVVTIAGQRFIGATLWFPKPKDNLDLRGHMSDFACIQDFEPWAYEQNRATRDYLKANVEPGDVVVTHHLPSPRCVDKMYEGDALNRYFVGAPDLDLEDLMRFKRPTLWVHGHTHCSVDLKIGDTRVVCNPYGYVGRELNPAFNPDCAVEV